MTLAKRPRPGSKDFIMLAALFDAGDKGLNPAEAGFRFGDTCWHSTTHRFRSVFGLLLGSRQEQFGRFGALCKRTWIDPAERPRVAAMLEGAKQ